MHALCSVMLSKVNKALLIGCVFATLAILIVSVLASVLFDTHAPILVNRSAESPPQQGVPLEVNWSGQSAVRDKKDTRSGDSAIQPELSLVNGSNLVGNALSPLRILEGCVIDQHGTPVRNIAVELFEDRNNGVLLADCNATSQTSVLTDMNGAFCFVDPPLDSWLLAISPDLQNEEQRHLSPTGAQVNREVQHNRSRMILTTWRGQWISGSVRERSGEPVEGAVVIARSEAVAADSMRIAMRLAEMLSPLPWNASHLSSIRMCPIDFGCLGILTDREGRFELGPLVPGTWEVLAQGRELRATGPRSRTSLIVPPVSEVVLVLEQTVSIRLLLSDQDSGAQIKAIWPSSTQVWVTDRAFTRATTLQVEQARDGQLQLNGIAPGVYSIIVSDENTGRAGVIRDFAVSSDDPLMDIQIPLSTAATVSLEPSGIVFADCITEAGAVITFTGMTATRSTALVPPGSIHFRAAWYDKGGRLHDVQESFSLRQNEEEIFKVGE